MTDPIPLTLPSILYSRLLNDRVPVRRRRRDENEGRKWVRRKENARFMHNPHITTPNSKDIYLKDDNKKPTFPEPLPSYLHRNTAVPSAVPTPISIGSSNMGRFGMSLRGARKDLRRGGPGVERVVRYVEGEITGWIEEGGTLIKPGEDKITFPGKLLFDGRVREMGRTPLKIVWFIPDNSRMRFIVHLVCRWWDVISFSKDTEMEDGDIIRLTYLLRPNVTRPDFRHRVWDTPPTTDVADTDSEVDSEIEPYSPLHLTSISESPPGSPLLEESIGSDVEADVEEEEGEEEEPLDERTPRANRTLTTGIRANSSPSRSPSRRPFVRKTNKVVNVVSRSKTTFYNYLYS